MTATASHPPNAPMNDELLFLSAQQAGRRIREGELRVVDYITTVLDAIEASQATLNACVTINREDARAAAAVADIAVDAGVKTGPLHGIPVTVKDMVAVAGMPNKNGSFTCENDIPTEDAPAVRRLRAAGAIVVAKTTTPEFGHKGLTDSLLSGITRNPWNLERTSGGSSGGAGAAVAAGLGPLGVGTDGAGSIRGPAATCGIVGLKPTRGMVPHPAQSDPFGNQSFTGPMTRTVGDAAMMLRVMSGADDSDPWSLSHGKVRKPDFTGDDLSGLTIGCAEKMANTEVAPDVVANTQACLDLYASLGAKIEPIPDGFDWAEEAGRVLYQTAIHHAVAPLLPEWADRLTPSYMAFGEWGAQWTAADMLEAQAARGDLFARVQGLFGRFDVLMSPTTARTALDADFDATADVMINGKACGITRQSWTAYQYPFNLTGHPALSVPSGFGEDGLPTGLQIIGPWNADPVILALGSILEARRPWADKRPTREARGLV